MIRNISVHTGREIVEDGNPVTRNQQRLDNMRGDKSCAAYDENVHFRFERIGRNARRNGMEPLPVSSTARLLCRAEACTQSIPALPRRQEIGLPQIFLKNPRPLARTRAKNVN